MTTVLVDPFDNLISLFCKDIIYYTQNIVGIFNPLHLSAHFPLYLNSSKFVLKWSNWHFVIANKSGSHGADRPWRKSLWIINLRLNFLLQNFPLFRHYHIANGIPEIADKLTHSLRFAMGDIDWIIIYFSSHKFE